MSNFPQLSTILSNKEVRLPDWPIDYTIIFDTSIIRRQDGSEKRFSGNKYPLKKYNFDTLFIKHESQVRALDHDINVLLSENELVDWTTIQDIRDYFSIGTNKTLLIKDASNISVNQEIALISDFNEFDARVAKVTVIAKTDNSITFVSDASDNYKKYTRIAHIARVYSNHIDSTQLTGRIRRSTIEWISKPGPRKLVNNNIDLLDDSRQYDIPFFFTENGNGYPIFTFHPDWSTLPTDQTSINNRLFGDNIFKFDNPENAGYKLWTILYTGSNNFLREIEYFINYVKGRFASFWFVPPIEQIKIVNITNNLQSTHYNNFTIDGTFKLKFTNNNLKFAIGSKIKGSDSQEYIIIKIENGGKDITLNGDISLLTYIQVYQAEIELSYPYNYLDNINFNKYLGLINLNNGNPSYSIREIFSIDNDDTTGTITVYGSINTDIHSIGPASIYRFSTDEFTFRYLTPAIGQINLQFFELSLFNNESLFNLTPDQLPPCCTQAFLTSMYYDPLNIFNSGREPIRANDLALPLSFDLTIKNTFSENEITLSDEVKEKLFTKHTLTYMGVMTGVRSDTSRNPYHIRLKGENPDVNWTMPLDPGISEVVRNWYQRSIDYLVGEDTFNLDIRLIFEKVINNDGLFGTLIYVIVFCNEINSDYIENDPFGDLNIPFTKQDPFVWGYNYGADSFRKILHPQGLIIAHKPTSLHAPIGYKWVGEENKRFKPCNAVTNGAPWSSNIPIDAELNSVFGTLDDGMAAITLGGGAISELFDWFCIEPNTPLEAEHLGWDETIGNLTVIDGVDIFLEGCIPTQSIFNTCNGHPNEPSGGIGGTHDCWRSSSTQAYFCIPTHFGLQPSYVESILNEACKTITTIFDEYNGTLCPIISQTCSSTIQETFLRLPLYDYTFAYNINQELRQMTYRVYIDDPEYNRRNWIFSDLTNFTDTWEQEIGDWTLEENPTGFSKATCTNPDGIGLFAGALNYLIDIPLNDAEIEFVVENYIDNNIGFRSRWDDDDGGNGYYYLFDANTNRLEIHKVESGVDLEINHLDIPHFTNPRKIIIKFEGAYHKLSLIANDGSSLELEVTNCFRLTSDIGQKQGLVIFGSTPNVIFKNIKVTDLNWNKVTAEVNFYADDNFDFITVPQISNHFGTCNIDETETCGNGTHCGCTQIFQIFGTPFYGFNTQDSTTSPNIVPWTGGIHNPIAACSEEPCIPGIPNCGNCPPPYATIQVIIPETCDNGDSTNIFKRGAEIWVVEVVSCP